MTETENLNRDIYKEITMEDYIQMFFTGKSLQTFITTLCNNNTHFQDSIYSILLSIAQNPITLTMTQRGLIPFRDQCTFVYPYHLMSQKQRNFLLQCVDIMIEEKSLIASTQMSGGCVISNASWKPKHILNPVDVLSSFCNAVFDNRTHNLQDKKFICSMILQRVGTTLGLCRRDLQLIQKLMNTENFEEQDINTATFSEEKHTDEQ